MKNDKKSNTETQRHGDTEKQMKFFKESGKSLSKKVLRASVSLWLIFDSTCF